MLTSVIGIVILLGGLIFFHELGHYTIAKLFRVRVEVFSLGFGRKLLKRQVGETEYCLSLIPLGGYVKLMGDDPYKGVPPELADRAFSTQKLYKRFAIVAAGPIANLLLAFLLYFSIYWIGQPVASTQIGTVLVDSPAWSAGFRPKDRVREVMGTSVQSWDDLEDSLKKRQGEKIEVKVERNGEELRIPVSVDRIRSKNQFGEEEIVGGIKGLQANPLSSVVGISDSASLAHKSGLRTGDQIVKIGSRNVEVWEDLNDSLERQWKEGAPLTLSVRRPKSGAKLPSEEVVVSLLLPSKPKSTTPFGLAQTLGIYPSDLFVRKVVPGEPAEKAGLKDGDRIVRVGGHPVYNFESIVDHVQSQGEKSGTVEFEVDRIGSGDASGIHKLSVKPVAKELEDPLTREKYKRFMIGFESMIAYREPDMYTLKIRSFPALVSKAAGETWLWVSYTVESVGKLVTGKVSAKNLGGPILIAKFAGRSLDAGIVPFFRTMALISINLFLLNLFPVPVLDGGHLLFFILEAFKGKPVSIKTMEIANNVGMALILMLVAVTFFNDISRLFH